MKFKNKRHIVIPAAILIYTIVIAIYFGVTNYTSEAKGTYMLVIGVNLVLVVVLYFILKRREDFRNNKEE